MRRSDSTLSPRLWARKNHAADLESAWKDLLISQSHDVSLCEYSRWQGDRFAPLDRIEDKHNYTWGSMGYMHLDAAEKRGDELLADALGYVSSQIDSESGAQGPLAVTVFNPCSWERSGQATTGRLYPPSPNLKGVVIKDASGRLVPNQMIKSEKDDAGNLLVADVAFEASKVPQRRLRHLLSRIHAGAGAFPPHRPGD